jgi:hypothetical protein
LLELAEEIFDEVTCLVGVFVEIALLDHPLVGIEGLAASKVSAAISGSSASAPSRS